MFRQGHPAILKHTVIFLLLLLQTAIPAQAQESRGTQIDSLKARVEHLEQTVKKLQQQLEGRQGRTSVIDSARSQADEDLAKEVAAESGVPSPAEDKDREEPEEEALARELAAELGLTAAPPQAPPMRPQPPRSGPGRRMFQNMNPNIGVIGNFIGTKVIDRETEEDGLTFNEAEISFQMVIDPFASSNVFVAVVPPEEAVELEEAYITLLSLPGSLQGRLGLFRPAFGKLNLTHPPETPFADQIPLVLKNFFGEEGLAETGATLNYLIPNRWDLFLELRLGVFDGDNEVSFNEDASSDLLLFGHFKSFFDLTENASVELGFSGLRGKNDAQGKRTTNLLGVDFIYRWKPLRRSQYESFTLQSEFLFSNRNTAGADVNSWGMFSFAEYQLSKRWFLGGRFDYSEFPTSSHTREIAYSAILTFWPSEFQTIRVQFRHVNRNFGDNDNALFLQWVFITGAHGAHAF